MQNHNFLALAAIQCTRLASLHTNHHLVMRSTNTTVQMD
uniref:Uncharacterized protein n=1 Tax=Arundo donax TaxID=35708 RepID=A0A0A9ESD5_ARUDO